MNIEELAVGTSLNITAFLMPWLAALFSIILALMIKDLATSFAKGLKFKMNREFNPGDVVLLDGEEAVIITIGLTKTVFEKISNKGIVWRYVPNERLAYLKLEKVIRSDVHKNGAEKKKETLLS
jgi:small-conductance mechanosensitive channel